MARANAEAAAKMVEDIPEEIYDPEADPDYKDKI